MFIVSFTNASSQPNAMMIEAHYTVVANIAMGYSLRSKNHACLTEFKAIKGAFVDVRVINSIFFKIDIEKLFIN